MKFNEKLALDLLNKSLKAAQTGQKLKFNDANEIAQYAFAVLGLGADLIPGVGPALGSLITLLGQVLFPVQTVDVWNKLRERVEALINAKIAEYHLTVLGGRVKGFGDNLDAVTDTWVQYDKASGEEKRQLGEVLRVQHTSFLMVARTSMPDFMMEKFAAPALPMFALAANIYLTLLADGIKHGEEWGFPAEHITNLRREFKLRTSPETAGVGAFGESRSELDSLLDAIRKGRELGWPPRLLETWKRAYFDLVLQPPNGDKGSDLDYPAHAKKFYLQGRKEVRPYNPELPEYENRGITAAAKLRAYADYDAAMCMNVLAYAEFWPYMTGEVPVPPAAWLAADREIFSGPYGRYTTYATWTEASEPPVLPRGEAVTAALVRGYDDVDGLQMKYGVSWGRFFGSETGGEARQLDLSSDEYIYSVGVHYGHKLGKVAFTTNKERYMENGNSMHGTIWGYACREGYKLSSVYITNWSGATPPGCEGIILGFRPVLLESGDKESGTTPSTETSHLVGPYESSHPDQRSADSRTNLALGTSSS